MPRLLEQQASITCVVSYFDCRPYRAIQLFGIYGDFQYLSGGLVSAHREQSRNSKLGRVLGTYIRPVTMSDSGKYNSP